MNRPESEFQDRRYARVDTEITARVRSVSAEHRPVLEQEIRKQPTVWGPTDETVLRKLATGSHGSNEALLAQSVLEVAKELVLIRSGLTPLPPDSRPCTVVSISGGGGRLTSPEPLAVGELLELFFEADRSGVPPVRVMIEISAIRPGDPISYGFRFVVIHPRDKDRLIRHAFRLQRRAIRESHEEAYDE